MIQVIKGKPIGTFNLIVVEELPPVIHKNYKERQVKVICPICGEPFVTDLRRLMRTDSSKRKAVRACPKCMQEYTNQRVAKLGKQSIKKFIQFAVWLFDCIISYRRTTWKWI